jgi:DNA-binding Lrp family transcriptional regulator
MTQDPPTFLTAVQGFTPVIDALAQAVGHTTAAVYGVVWRYCQMDERVCRASVAQIGRRLGLHPKTTRRHLKKLCELGYLEDTTPDRNNGPLIYRDIGADKIIALTQSRPQTTHQPKQNPAFSASSAVEKHPDSNSAASAPTASARLSHVEASAVKKHRDTPDAPHNSPRPRGTERPTKREIHESKNQEKGGAAVAANARHPAIRAFRKNAHRYPAKSWFQDVAETVGEHPADVEFWGQIVKAWVGVGYNPVNVLGMLDCYRRGELPSTAASRAAGHRRHGPPSRLQSTIETGIRILKQEGKWPT